MLTASIEYPCPCCGYLVFRTPPGTHGVCPICRWEDDLAQLRFPLMPGSANRASLHDAQQNYANYGASNRMGQASARKPTVHDVRDAEWRPINTRTDNIEEPRRGVDYATSYPIDTTVLYYWRSTYWRAGYSC